MDFGTVNGTRGPRRFYRTEAEANSARRNAEKETKLAGDWWSMQSTEAKQSAIAVFREMAKDGTDPAKVWKAYKSFSHSVPSDSVGLKTAIYEMLNAKKAAGRKDRYRAELEAYLLRFAKNRESLPVAKVTVSDIERWFSDRKEASTTRASNLGRLSALFGFCVRRGYLMVNPCTSVERTSTDGIAPKVFTLDQVRLLLKACMKDEKPLLAYIALGVFAGIRPEELQKITWANVDLRRKRVMIDHSVTKVRQWRIVPLEPAACDWLKLCDKSGSIAPNPTALRRARRRLRDRLGLEWPQDVLRHTAASYLLVTDWRKFWAIRPARSIAIKHTEHN